MISEVEMYFVWKILARVCPELIQHTWAVALMHEYNRVTLWGIRSLSGNALTETERILLRTHPELSFLRTTTLVWWRYEDFSDL
jgi:hypothetical protein